MEEAIAQIALETRTKYYGKYRGFVVDNGDPEKRGRVKVRVPSVLASATTDWALPCLPFGGGAGYGLFAVPEVDAQLWVEFEEGDVHRPIWTGTFWQKESDTPPDAAIAPPTTRLFQTPCGHRLQFDDKSSEERILLEHPKGASLEIDPRGSIVMTDAAGAHITLDAEATELTIADSHGNEMKLTSTGTQVVDANGNKLEMTAAGVTVKAQRIVVQGNQVLLGGDGGEPLIKGQTFLTLFATHVHPVAGPGSSGPPVPQGEMVALSSKVFAT